jgi:hypothetical protein
MPLCFSQCGHEFDCPSSPSCLCANVARVSFLSCVIATTQMLSKSLLSQSSTCLTSAASAPWADKSARTIVAICLCSHTTRMNAS